jgi:hypothetical protein
MLEKPPEDLHNYIKARFFFSEFHQIEASSGPPKLNNN